MENIKLPFDHTVIGYVSPGNNRVFVAVARDHPIHPFVSYEVGITGECLSGDYVETRSAAIASMMDRAAKSCGDFRLGLEAAQRRVNA